jgi:hypothetical protein
MQSGLAVGHMADGYVADGYMAILRRPVVHRRIRNRCRCEVESFSRPSFHCECVLCESAHRAVAEREV